jgi:hypothetical protein
MKHKISIILILLAATSCMKVKKKGDEEVKQPEITMTQVEPEPEPESEPIPAVEPARDPVRIQKVFSYGYESAVSSDQVIFNIPNDWGDLLWVEKSIDGKIFFQAPIDIKNTQWKDKLSSDQKTNYKFFQGNSKNSKLLTEVEVLPALELFVNEDFNLAQTFQLNSKTKKIYIRKLDIRNSSRLFVEDYKGEIIIEELISDHGILQSFEAQKRAASEKDGRSVGGFDLKVLSGSGNLKIALYAESGGDGQPGREPDEKLNGQDGVEGTPAEFTLNYHDKCSICVPLLYYICSKPGGSGTDGAQGLRGYPGSDAGSGGSVEKINIANNSSEVKIDVIAFAGKKGIGALGGRGGKGGQPGRGADGNIRDFYKFNHVDPDDPNAKDKIIFKRIEKTCEAAKDGNPGALGESGPKGRDGQDGIAIQTEIKN